MLKLGLSLLVLIATFLNGFAFEAGRARELMNKIASDEFQGRQPGTAGGEKIEQFLAEKLSEYGVYQGGKGSYFQELPLLVTEERSSTVTLMDHPLGKIPMVLGADYTLITHSGSGTVLAPVVFVGNGYVRPDKDRDDYAGADVKGKIVVIVRGYPDSPYDFHEDFPRTHTLQWAEDHGAAAVIWYQGGRVINGAAIPWEKYNPKMPMLFAGDRLINLLLDGTGYTLKTYQDKIKNAPLSLDTGKRLYVSVDVRKKKQESARNVLGMIYGTDPTLKNEVIIIGAHMDHLGENANHVIYNGAEDNASGTVLVSELARSLAANPPKRSVLICHFTGEELGLLGSDYLAHNPTIPIGNAVCMLNFDMVGEGNGHIVMAGGDALGSTFNDYIASLDSAGREEVTFGREDGYGASDNLSFQYVGVPAVAFWSKGDHLYYHHYSDDPDWISDSVLQTMGNRAEDFIRWIGDRPGTLAYGADSLKLMTNFEEVLDFKGVAVDAQGSVSSKHGRISAAWVAPEPTIVTTEILRRTGEFQFACANHNVATGDLKAAIDADQNMKDGVFLAISETALSSRHPAEIDMLIRQGVKVIQLSKGGEAGAKSAPLDVLDEARKQGAYALIPLDFNTPARVARWKTQGIVVGTLKDFVDAPTTVRDGLLKSDALLILEATTIPTPEQLATVAAGKVRRVHINNGTAPAESMVAEQRATVRALYAAGFSRSDILSLTGGNLRHFLGM